MVTPKEYKENLKNGIITASMLEDVLYSYNKRAKNYRDLARKYREMYDCYNNEGKYEEIKGILYGKKADILSCCKDYLCSIHKVLRCRRIRIEDIEGEYFDYLAAISSYEKGEKSEVVYMNSYYDSTIEELVTFININKSFYEYYLYYQFPHYSFHTPIGDDMRENINLSKYMKLDIIEIEGLTTYGKDIEDLLSLQFCDKVWTFMKNR